MKESLKIALLTHEFYPVLSGGTVFADKISESFKKLGAQTTILTGAAGGARAGVEKTDAWNVKRFRVGRSSISDARLLEHLWFLLFGLPQFFLHCLKTKYDVIFSVFAAPSGLIGLIIGKLLGIPTFVFVDAADTPGVDSAMKKFVRILAPLFRFVVNHSTGVIVLEGLEDMAMPHIRNPKTIVLPNGASLPAQPASPGKNPTRKLEILSIGRLVSRKGFDTLISALDLAKKRTAEFHLTIIGYGGKQAELEESIRQRGLQDHVTLQGRIEYRDLEKFYLSSDAYIFCGGREGSSLAMIEAAAYGLPVIASDHPGNRTFVIPERNGILIDSESPDSIADAIVYLVNYRRNLPKMGSESRAIAANYTWDLIARRYLDFFIK